jgi:hypothetical protein
VAKKTKKPAPDRVAIDSAVGIVAWLLVVELLVFLERRGVLKSKDTKRIVAGALHSLDMLEGGTLPHPSFAIAREILLGQIEGWDRGYLRDEEG